MTMKNLLHNSIDWMSIKLNAICLIGLIATSNLLTIFTLVATITTILYNAIRIYKEIKNPKQL